MAAPMKKAAGPDLAIILGGGPKGKGKPMPSEPPMDEDMPDDEADGMGGAFDVAAEEFLDETLPMEDRKAALKRAVMACMSEDY